MQLRLSTLASLISACLAVSTALPSRAEPVDLSKPTCPFPYLVNAGKCVADVAAVNTLTSAANCTAAGGTLTGAVCKLPDTAPTPACRSVAGGTQSLKGEICVFDTGIQTSASGDYVGDYFEIVAVPADRPNLFGAPSGSHVKVMSQKALGPDDKMLTVVSVGPTQLRIFNSNTPVGGGHAKEVKASDLIEYGAKRTGWTYGALAIPYKYYTHDKSFGPGISIGPYAGRRWGRPGSAYTLAVAATIGNVKGEVRDEADKIVSTPDLMAYSVAAGLMWDISKAQGVKPFKLGVFVGADSVSTDDVVKFKNNRKPWLALQIGFDFTDN